MSPHTYAALYRAGRAGIRAANPTALVAIGETSNQGRDRPVAKAVADSVAPGTFARLLARERGCCSTPTRPTPTRPDRVAAEREGALAERDAVAAPAIRGGARPLVRAAGHPRLDHRVRLPDEDLVTHSV